MKYSTIMSIVIFVNISFLIELSKYGTVCLILLFSFKNNLDKFWFNEEVKYNWKAGLTGTGNQSLSK